MTANESETPEMNLAALKMMSGLAQAALAMRDALLERAGTNWGPDAQWVDETLEEMGYGPEATSSDSDYGGTGPSMN